MKNEVRVVFTEQVYKKHPWIIPIIKLSENNFMTGQELDHKKKVGLEPLTAEEKKSYPHIINPDKYYRLANNMVYDRNSSYDSALLDLAIISGRMAPSYAEYQVSPKQFVGYLKDNLTDAVEYNKLEDLRYDAQTAIRSLPMSEYAKVALIINFRMGKAINVDTMPTDYVKAELLKAANEDPKSVKLCFPKWNKGIELDIYILQLIHKKILSKSPNNDIYDGTVYVGNGIEGVKGFMTQSHNQHYINKWKTMLDGESKVVVESNYKPDTSDLDAYRALVSQTRKHIEAKNIFDVESNFNTLNEKYAEFLTRAESEFILNALHDLKKDSFFGEEAKKKKAFEDELNSLDLEKLQKKIQHRNSPYEQKSCEGFWQDKDKLIEYMLKTKFNV